MVYKVKITHFANKAAKKLSPEIKKAAKAAMKELAEDSFRGKELQAELSGFRSYRFLRYRVIYRIDTENKIIVVWGIGHRRDIYESLSEHLASEIWK